VLEIEMLLLAEVYCFRVYEVCDSLRFERRIDLAHYAGFFVIDWLEMSVPQLADDYFRTRTDLTLVFLVFQETQINKFLFSF
jgi:hypothetical protein